MIQQQVVNLLTFTSLILNEKITMPSYIFEKFGYLIGHIVDIVIRPCIEEDKIDMFLQSTNLFWSNQKPFGVPLYLYKGLSIKEKMIVYYLKSFNSYGDMFSNFEKYIGSLSLINKNKAYHIHPNMLNFVNKEISNNLRIVNLYKLLY